MILMVAGSFHIAFCLPLIALLLRELYFSSLLNDLEPEGVHADYAVFVFLYLLPLLIQSFLRKLMEVVVLIEIPSPLLRDKEPWISLLLEPHYPCLHCHYGYKYNGSRIVRNPFEQI